MKEREAKLKKELAKITYGIEHRKKVGKHTLPSVALVGYTNAGKSAVLNLATNARVESEDRLF